MNENQRPTPNFLQPGGDIPWQELYGRLSNIRDKCKGNSWGGYLDNLANAIFSKMAFRVKLKPLVEAYLQGGQAIAIQTAGKLDSTRTAYNYLSLALFLIGIRDVLVESTLWHTVKTLESSKDFSFWKFYENGKEELLQNSSDAETDMAFVVAKALFEIREGYVNQTVYALSDEPDRKFIKLGTADVWLDDLQNKVLELTDEVISEDDLISAVKKLENVPFFILCQDNEYFFSALLIKQNIKFMPDWQTAFKFDLQETKEVYSAKLDNTPAELVARSTFMPVRTTSGLEEIDEGFESVLVEPEVDTISVTGNSNTSVSKQNKAVSYQLFYHLLQEYVWEYLAGSAKICLKGNYVILGSPKMFASVIEKKMVQRGQKLTAPGHVSIILSALIKNHPVGLQKIDGAWAVNPAYDIVAKQLSDKSLVRLEQYRQKNIESVDKETECLPQKKSRQKKSNFFDKSTHKPRIPYTVFFAELEKYGWKILETNPDIQIVEEDSTYFVVLGKSSDFHQQIGDALQALGHPLHGELHFFTTISYLSRKNQQAFRNKKNVGYMINLLSGYATPVTDEVKQKFFSLLLIPDQDKPQDTDDELLVAAGDIKPEQGEESNNDVIEPKVLHETITDQSEVPQNKHIPETSQIAEPGKDGNWLDIVRQNINMAENNGDLQFLTDQLSLFSMLAAANGRDTKFDEITSDLLELSRKVMALRKTVKT